MKLEQLSWDTNFFAKPVYKIEVKSSKEMNDAKAQVPKGSLIYAFSKNEIPEFSQLLVDQKLTFGCHFEKPNMMLPIDCEEFSGHNFAIQDIEHLAIVSSQQSRFRVDKKIDSVKVDELYRLWVKRALADGDSHRIIGKVVNNDLAGMVLMRIFPDFLRIDLIAVDEKFQGQGIGGDLIQSSFTLANHLGKTEVQVTTQGDNRGACALYKKYGFSVIEQKFIYHIHV